MQNSVSNDCFGNVRALERRDFYKRWARRLVVAVVVAAVGFAGYRGYGVWRKRHLSQQAQDFFAHKDYQSAVLVARHLLQLDPKSIAACRVMAETAESAGRREALSWREQVAVLDPCPENQVSLAGAALKFGQLAQARTALDHVAESGRANVKYRELAGTLAIAERNPALAQIEFAAALQLDPQNQQLAVNLATVAIGGAVAYYFLPNLAGGAIGVLVGIIVGTMFQGQVIELIDGPDDDENDLVSTRS